MDDDQRGPGPNRPDRPDQDSPTLDRPDQDRFAQHGFGAARLLALLAELPPPTVAGLEPTDDALQFHLRPIDDDPRGTLAGLFELVVPESWQAIAVCVEGSEDSPGADAESDVDIRALLTRSGELCTRIDGTEHVVQFDPSIADDAPSGLLVDCLHRILGMPSPGSPPDPVDVALGTWAQSMIERLFDRGDLSWADAVALHPGTPRTTRSSAHSPIDPSIETMVEATFRSTENWSWERMHRRARQGSVTAALTASEASWMDTTMYGRWVMSHLADPIGVADLLDSHDFREVAVGLRAVVEGVEHWRDPLTAA